MLINSDFDLAVIRVVSAHRLLNSPVGVYTLRKNRSHWGLILKNGGKTIYTVGERQILSDAFHPVLLPRGSSYSWKCMEPGECLIIEFDALQEGGVPLSFTLSDNSTIVNGFSKIEKSLNMKTAVTETECKYWLYGMLLHLAKSVKKEYVSRDKQELLQPALRYLAENYRNSGITNDLLAERCGISTVYFRKIFGQIYGVPPIQYLHQFRIEKAKAILRSDFGSVEQVARSVGYNSIYHFSKMFKVYTGKSPTEYAKEIV